MQKIITYLLAFMALVLASVYAQQQYQKNLQKSYAGSDFASIWQEGARVCQGENPYSRFNSGEKRAKYKPPTYFPGFYIIACGLQKIFPDQQTASGAKSWMVLNTLTYLALGILIMLAFVRIGQPEVGLIMMTLFLFARWSLHTTSSLQTNFLALLPLFVSLVFCRKAIWVCSTFALSLVIKQLAIFVVPVYLFSDINLLPKYEQIKIIVKRAVYIAIIPTVLMIPFLINDANGVFSSILYSAGRVTKNVTVIESEMKSLIMLFGFLITYWAVYLGKVSKSLGTLIIFLFFVGLHRVFFSQYYLWVLVVIIAFVHEYIREQSKLKENL